MLFFLCVSSIVFSQVKIEGEYYYVDGTGEYFNNYKFFKNGIFSYKDGSDLGVSNYGRGRYLIKNDSLTLNYDLTELKTNDYHTYKKYINNKDFIKVKITIRNMTKKPLPDVSISNFSNKIEYKTNKKGVVEFVIKKERKKLDLYIVNNALGYDFNIWGNKNYEIDVFLRQDNYATAYKNQIIKYKILKLTKEEIKLKAKNSFLLLKRKN